MHSFKKTAGVVLAVLMFFVLLYVLDVALYPCTYTRNDIHKVVTEQRDVLILGGSEGKMNIDPDILLEGTGLTGHNLAAGGEYPVDAYYQLQLVIEKQDPKMVIYDADAGYLLTKKDKGNNELLFYHEFPVSAAKAKYAFATMGERDFRAMLYPFYEYTFPTVIKRAGSTISQKLSRDYDISKLRNDAQHYLENGHIAKTPVDPSNFPGYQPLVFEEGEYLDENMEYLGKIISLCKEKGITFVAVSLPLPQGVLLVNPEEYEKTYQYLNAYFEEQKVPYYNFNKDYFDAFSHDASCFVDYDGHLNEESAEEFSKVFGELLKDEFPAA